MNLKKTVTEAEWLARVDLAAFHRLVANYGWDDLLLAHLSCRVPGEDAYLINPFGLLFEEITAALARGDRVELRGFGAFSVKQRDARMGRNPRTGASVPVPEKAVPFFKAGKELRERMNGQD